MAQKPETRFSKALHDRFPESVYVEKTHNPYRGGIPDFYYEFGEARIMWCEHKFYTRLPPVMNLVESEKLTPLQARWLKRAYSNGIKACVIIGFKVNNEYRVVVLHNPVEWATDIHRESILDFPMDLDDAVKHIHSSVEAWR